MVGEILFTLLVALAMLVGLAGNVIPFFPDIALIWGAALVYGLVVGMAGNGAWLFALISVLGVAGLTADVWMSGWGARYGGARFQSVLAGFALAALGAVLLGPFGALGGLLLGTFALEYYRTRQADQALKASVGAGVGCGTALLVKGVISMAMIGAWVIWLFAG
jgi:uncharacterized protein YqgC (DUF456 family)